MQLFAVWSHEEQTTILVAAKVENAVPVFELIGVAWLK